MRSSINSPQGWGRNVGGTWFDRLSSGLSKSRQQLAGSLNQLIGRGPSVDAQFWEDLEEALIGADVGAEATLDIVGKLRLQANAEALPDAEAVLGRLRDLVAAEFVAGPNPFDVSPVTVIVVGVNGAGKTTTVGKLAALMADSGRKVVVGNGDTFRAAAAEQLAVWADRANVQLVSSERGTDPAAVAFDTVVAAAREGADLTIIDTAGRLHTSTDLMTELQKVQRVVRDRSMVDVFTVLVLDSTTGQNGLVQALEFNRYLSLDAVILTKLDGTAKGGIAIAVSRALKVPVLYAGVGESLEDLLRFSPDAYAEALVGTDVR